MQKIRPLDVPPTIGEKGDDLVREVGFQRSEIALGHFAVGLL
jgi:hypothetical protein